jgi:hypothetical protein
VAALIQREKQPRNPAAFVHRLATDGELPDWLNRSREDNRRRARAEALRKGVRCHRCATRYVGDGACPQCGTPRTTARRAVRTSRTL